MYDVKDHPDYKFRPGHVVVRVGGYEESHTEAAGQVFELTQDGQLLIQWADKTRTKCYPQELYLIGDEVSLLKNTFTCKVFVNFSSEIFYCGGEKNLQISTAF